MKKASQVKERAWGGGCKERLRATVCFRKSLLFNLSFSLLLSPISGSAHPQTYGQNLKIQ